MLNRFMTGFALLGAMGASVAQNTPVGKWHSIDDKTKEIKSEITIIDTNGLISGRVTKLLRKDVKQDEVCEKCTDDRKDKPILGMQIIRGAKKSEGKDVWEGGKVLDPENGSTYSLRLTPIDGGKKMEMRGSIFGIGRTQVWERVQ